jgi:predicted dehydrogenase
MIANYCFLVRPDLDFRTFEKTFNMKTIRWGVIGCGNVTEVKSGPGFQLAENSELAAIMCRNADKAQDWAQRHQVEKWYTNPQLLIEDPGIDIIYVATPPVSHLEYTLLAAKAGKPVYVEKPMAINYRQCQEMIEACKSAGVQLFVAYYRRALPRFLKIKSLIENGEIGEVRCVNVLLHIPPSKDDLDKIENWRTNPEISGGGYFVDLACHTLDILQFYFGHIIFAHGNAANLAGLYPAEDMVIGNFIFSNGVQGTGTWCFSAYDHLDRTEIVGNKGKITFATFGNDPVVLETKSERKVFNLPNPVHIQQPLIQTMVDELLGKGKCPSTGVTASRTNWAMDRTLI